MSNYFDHLLLLGLLLSSRFGSRAQIYKFVRDAVFYATHSTFTAQRSIPAGSYKSCLLARYVIGVIMRVYLLQLLTEVKATLQHQVTVEYNATATYSKETRTRTHRITVAWDALQSRVLTQNSTATYRSVNKTAARSLLLYFLLTFRVSRRRREMYIGHARLCVCLSVCLSVRGRILTLLHGPGFNLGEWFGCPLVVHYWVDLQSVTGCVAMTT